MQGEEQKKKKKGEEPQKKLSEGGIIKIENKEKEKKGKIKGKTENKEIKNRELVRQTCTNRLFPSLPLKILPPAKNKRGSFKH